MPGYRQKRHKKRSKNRSTRTIVEPLPENVQPENELEIQPITLSNFQIENYKKYIFVIETLDKLGLTVYDVLEAFYTLPLEWQEYYLMFPDETERYIGTKLGNPDLFKGFKKRKKKQRTKKQKTKKKR